MNKNKLLLWSIVAALAGFIFGFDTVVISGANQPIKDLWHTTPLFHGFFIMSMALWGTVVGAIFGGLPTQKLGRKKVLVWIGWEKLIRKSNPIEKNIKTLTNLHYQTKKSELDHLIILIIVAGFNVLVAFKFGIVESLWLLLLNILLNLYPIFLQRYNRPRIERAINVGSRR